MTDLKSPSWIDQVNGVVRIVTNPCDAPWAVYFETAQPAAGRAIISLLEFGMLDLIRAYFRPKNLRSGRHGRRGRRGGRKARGIPDLPEVIAKRIPGQEAVASRQVSTGVKHLWLIDGVLQRILWWWLVIDVVGTFFYEWATLIEQTGFCDASTQARGLWIDQEGGYPGVAGWVGPTGGSRAYEALTVSMTQNSATVGPGRYLVTGSIGLENLGPGLTDIGVRLRQVTPAQLQVDEAFYDNLVPGETQELAVSITVDGPADVSFEARSDGASAIGKNGMLFAMRLDKG